MSSTSEALVKLAEQKEQLRIIANRYLEQQDRLSVDCTMQDIIDVLNEYDEYTYMNAFLNSIEVFPDKDYSINDTKGHIKGVRPYSFSGNTALKSVLLAYKDVNGYFPCISDMFSGCSNLKVVSLPNIEQLTGSYVFRNAKQTNILLCPRNVRAFNSGPLREGYISILLIRGGTFDGGYCTYNWYSQTADQRLIIVEQSAICTLTSVGSINSKGVQVFVPENLLDPINPNEPNYRTATNWVTVNSNKEIKDIESNINDLRELGAGFSYTPYANKKWNGTELVYDPTIGEEEDE